MSEIEELRAKLEESNQLNQECGRSLKGLLEWSQKADVALEKCVEAIETAGHFMAYDSEARDYYPFSRSLAYSEALTLARPLLKTRPERN